MPQLDVPCFRYLGKDWHAPLGTVQLADEGEVRLQCLVRRRPIRMTPEEQVRQALIYFLTEGSRFAEQWKEHLRIGIEERSLDVAGFYRGQAFDLRFCPGTTVIIFEAKRRERNLLQDAGQLKNYMLRERCRAGLLFNGKQAIWLTLAGSFVQPEWKSEFLSDFADLDARLEATCASTHALLADRKRTFDEAARGSFDALTCLATEFGMDRGLTFVMSVRVKNALMSVQAFSPEPVQADAITYRARGVASRNRLQLHRDDFHSLLAIRPA